MNFDYTNFKNIDKKRYSKHLKISFFCACLYLLVIALFISTVLIHFMGDNNGDNFWLNIIGVAIALFSGLALYSQIKKHPFFEDIVYVRQLKAQLNYIYRKQKKVLESADKGDTDAMSILDFSYRASRYVYELDDNTLTLEELGHSEQALKSLTMKYKVECFCVYHPDLIKNY